MVPSSDVSNPEPGAPDPNLTNPSSLHANNLIRLAFYFLVAVCRKPRPAIPNPCIPTIILTNLYSSMKLQTWGWRGGGFIEPLVSHFPKASSVRQKIWINFVKRKKIKNSLVKQTKRRKTLPV